jgi:hypothetical protein
MRGLPDESQDNYATHQKQQKKNLIILLCVAFIAGIAAFGMYAHHYIIWDGVETKAVVNQSNTVVASQDPPFLLLRYTYMVEGKVFENMENYYNIPDYQLGDLLYIEYSSSNPSKHHVLGLAYRDGESYTAP